MNVPRDSSVNAPAAGTSAELTLENSEWRAFLLQFYHRAKAATPTTTLRAVYHLAKRQFEVRNKRCDVDLSLIANHRKHKK